LLFFIEDTLRKKKIKSKSIYNINSYFSKLEINNTNESSII
jgi:hypothetical protein